MIRFKRILIFNFLVIIFLIPFYKVLSFDGNLKANDTNTVKVILPELFYDFDSVKILTDTLSFNGYIVFEVTKSDSVANSKYFNCKVYFIQSLRDWSNVYDRLYYVWNNILIYNGNSLRKDGVLNRYYIDKISGRYSGKSNFNKYPFFNLNRDSTSIFNNKRTFYLSSYPDKYFYIFKTQFDGLLIQNNLYYWRKDNVLSSLSNVQVLIPYVEKIPIIDLDDEEMNEQFR